MQTATAWQIHKLAFVLEKQADEIMKGQLDIGFAQYKVLEAINQNDLAKQNTVAELLDQTEASISRQIRILKQKGLITVREVQGNKRARELRLSGVGEDIVRQAAHVVDQVYSPAITALNFSEQQQLSDMLGRLLQAVESSSQ